MNQLGLFAKFWEPGQVKTRLARDIGPLKASNVYQAFVRHLLKKFAKVADRRVLVFSPTEKEKEFTAIIGDNWDSQPQSAGDLGHRMGAFFEQALEGPKSSSSNTAEQKVILIGTDSPQLSTTLIEDTFESLSEKDIVLGPCPDGGYYLVGMKKPDIGIFAQIDWSSEMVLQQTLARSAELNLEVALMPEMTDIDYLDDLRIVQNLVANGSNNDLDRRLFEDVQQILDETIG